MTAARRRRARGMTLVELMVAVVALSLMTVLGWRALDGILRARGALSEQLVQLRGHQLAFAQMEADCARLVRSALFDARPTLSATPGRLMLLRGVDEDGGPDRLQIVVYRNDGGVLTRSTSAATRDLGQLHAAWQAALAGVDGFDGVALDARVAAFELKTWSGGAWQDDGAAAGGGPGAGGRRPRRVVRPPSTEAAGLQVLLRPEQGAEALVRLFMLGAG
jgi:general secretion pathway protein J